jgi:hypothetical protein
VPVPQALSNPGPFFRHEPVAFFAGISQGAFDAYHAHIDEVGSRGRSPRQHTVVAMMYLAESTSAALRLNASWALTTPAMSLCRDRYEQTVRFSWLARTRDDREWDAYFADVELRYDRLERSMSDIHREELAKILGDPKLATWPRLTPERRAEAERWSKIPFEQLVIRRDKAPMIGVSPVGREPLRNYYSSIYRQFSSVAHADAYGLSMLELHPSANGEHVLTPDPHWPAMLLLHVALFDLIQCYEAVGAFFPGEEVGAFDELHASWSEGWKRFAGDGA